MIMRLRNGQLNYKVKDFTDRSMIGKTGTIHVRVTMKNYKDVSYDLTVTLTDQKKVVLKAGSEIKVLQDRKLTYGETLSNQQLNLEGKEKAVFVEQGTDTQIPGTLAWKDGTQRPDTSVTSAEWIFTPDDVAYAKAEGSTAITVEAKKLEITAATADDNFARAEINRKRQGELYSCAADRRNSSDKSGECGKKQWASDRRTE